MIVSVYVTYMNFDNESRRFDPRIFLHGLNRMEQNSEQIAKCEGVNTSIVVRMCMECVA